MGAGGCSWGRPFNHGLLEFVQAGLKLGSEQKNWCGSELSPVWVLISLSKPIRQRPVGAGRTLELVETARQLGMEEWRLGTRSRSYPRDGVTLNLVKAGGEAQQQNCQDPVTVSLLPGIVASISFILALFIILRCRIKYKSSHHPPESSS